MDVQRRFILHLVRSVRREIIRVMELHGLPPPRLTIESNGTGIALVMEGRGRLGRTLRCSFRSNTFMVQVGDTVVLYDTLETTDGSSPTDKVVRTLFDTFIDYALI
ncbi:MAG: hypothetical protein GXO29_01700 [Thermotogae bacterium]|nr:hypothetical protein [Thermotogota bacterium]